MWYCQSCNADIEALDRVGHFKEKHWFKPVQVQTPVLEQIDNRPKKEENVDLDNAGTFYFEEFSVDTECPDCRMPSTIAISITEKSCKMVCTRQECGHVHFYRHVVLQRTVSQ